MLQSRSSRVASKRPDLQPLQPRIRIIVTSLEPRAPDREDMIPHLWLRLILNDLVQFDQTFGLGECFECDLWSKGELILQLVVRQSLGFLDMVVRRGIFASMNINDGFVKGFGGALRMKCEILCHGTVVILRVSKSLRATDGRLTICQAAAVAQCDVFRLW